MARNHGFVAMELKHRQFINSLVSLSDSNTRPLIECAIKEYILIEGPSNFLNRAKSVAGNIKGKIASMTGKAGAPAKQEPEEQVSKTELKARNFTPSQERARQYLIEMDRKTWDRDYDKFQQACDSIKYFVTNYGNREFNELRRSDDFKRAEKRGSLIDEYIRINPQKLADERRTAYRNLMDSVCQITPEHKELIESILNIYDITEGVTRTTVIPLCESSNRDYAVSQLKNDMATVEVFVTKHGIYPWEKFLKSREFRDAYINSGAKNPTDTSRAKVDPDIVSTVRNAFSSGASVMESNDAGTEKLEKYLNKKPDAEIKDEDGYIDTTKKAFNYFDNARIVDGEWAMHFTNEEIYKKIQKNGFSHGTSNLDHLAYTSHFPDGRSKQGWLFAVPVDTAFLKHYDMRYGDCAFLIKTDGVIAKHVGERDVELLFRPKDVIERIPFKFDKDSKKWVTELTEDSYATIGQLVADWTKEK